MKKLVFALLLFLPLLSFGQKTVLLSLKDEPLASTGNKYRIFKVLDSRKDTTQIGVIQTGLFNNNAFASLKNGCATEVERFVKKD